jgi:hypothetical protein
MGASLAHPPGRAFARIHTGAFMHSILFSRSNGAPIAILGLSSPIAPTRNCIFVVAARDTETYNSPEGQVILPDRPHEYACRYAADDNGTAVDFDNQNGWHFRVELDSDDSGSWTATKGSDALRGTAISLSGACAVDGEPAEADTSDQEQGGLRGFMSSLRQRVFGRGS